jgi:hypothetical protein
MLPVLKLVGLRTLGLLADGAESALRLAREGALLVAMGAGALQEAADRSRLFYACTAAAGVAPGTSISTTSAFCLANPNNSGVNLVVRKAWMGYKSGTLAPGSVFACLGQSSQTAVTGTAIAEVQGKGGGVGARGKPLTTATVPAAPGVMFPIFEMRTEDGTGVGSAPVKSYDFEGGVIVPPGAYFVLHSIAGAGTSPLVYFGCACEEVPA